MLGNRCLDHTEKPPSRPTDYVIRHILHVSRPNSNVGSEWRKSTRIIDRSSSHRTYRVTARRVRHACAHQGLPAPRPCCCWQLHTAAAAERGSRLRSLVSRRWCRYRHRPRPSCGRRPGWLRRAGWEQSKPVSTE